MKLKTAQRILARGKWKAAAVKLYGTKEANHKFLKQQRKATKIVAKHRLESEIKAILKKLF